MTVHQRWLGAWLALALAASAARAEGAGPPGAGTDRRIQGASGLRAVKGGFVSVGGPALRRLAAGARTWQTLHEIPGDNLYRVAADDSGRLLAAWEKDALLHLFSPEGKLVASLPKPASPPDLETRYQVEDLRFLPGGREALVYVSGTVKVTTGQFRGPSWSTAAYRIALDGRAEAEQLFRVDHGFRLHTSPRGAVFAMNKYPGRKCDHGECLVAAVVAYELTPGGVRQRTLVDGEQVPVDRARLVRGGDDDRVALLLDLWKPRSLALVRWRYGDEQAELRSLPRPGRDDGAFLLTRAGAVVELRMRQAQLELWRHGPAGEEQLATLGALQGVDTGLHGFGERADGSLWIHWGDHLALVSPDAPPRSYDLSPLLPHRADWGGDLHVAGPPEHLWVGLDGSGRDYVRVDLADAERRSRPWPAAARAAPAPGGEKVAADGAKDGSTEARLYGAVTVRPAAGGLVSLGGAALRRLPAGAKRWETLHAVPGDNLYRVAADDSGRVLAAWEKDPSIHYFPARGPRVALPRPAKPPDVPWDFRVDDLALDRDGHSALVFMEGQLDAGQRRTLALYRIALDGASEPRLVFRVDDACCVHTSRAGAVCVLPREPGRQECGHRTCWPVAAVVAFELGDDGGVRRRTVLDGRIAEDLDVSSASVVPGSDDARVGLVLELTRRRGAQRLNGGRAVLRWRSGEERVDYRPLLGSSPLMPRWRLTRELDFIELTLRQGKPEYLEVHRYPLGGGEETISLKERRRMSEPYGVGERQDGGLWLHWGDHLALLSPGRPPRGVDLDPLRPRGFEWAGAARYVERPEALWLGLDGRGRNYVRLDLAEAERRAHPWPE